MRKYRGVIQWCDCVFSVQFGFFHCFDLAYLSLLLIPENSKFADLVLQESLR